MFANLDIKVLRLFSDTESRLKTAASKDPKDLRACLCSLCHYIADEPVMCPQCHCFYCSSCMKRETDQCSSEKGPECKSSKCRFRSGSLLPVPLFKAMTRKLERTKFTCTSGCLGPKYRSYLSFIRRHPKGECLKDGVLEERLESIESQASDVFDQESKDNIIVDLSEVKRRNLREEVCRAYGLNIDLLLRQSSLNALAASKRRQSLLMMRRQSTMFRMSHLKRSSTALIQQGHTHKDCLEGLLRICEIASKIEGLDVNFTKINQESIELLNQEKSNLQRAKDLTREIPFEIDNNMARYLVELLVSRPFVFIEATQRGSQGAIQIQENRTWVVDLDLPEGRFTGLVDENNEPQGFGRLMNVEQQTIRIGIFPRGINRQFNMQEGRVMM